MGRVKGSHGVNKFEADTYYLFSQEDRLISKSETKLVNAIDNSVLVYIELYNGYFAKWEVETKVLSTGHILRHFIEKVEQEDKED